MRVANSTRVIWGERDAFLDRACNETLPRCTAPTSSVWKTTASPATAVELTADYTRQFANPYYAAERGYIDAVIEPQKAGIPPTGTRATWGHDQLQATFARELINRRKVYPSALRDVLPRVYLLREAADYKRDVVSDVQAARALQRTRIFLQAIQG